MRTSLHVSPALLALATLAACADAPPDAAPAALARPAPVSTLSLVSPTATSLAAQQGAFATSVDERGVPRFVVSAGQRVEAAALPLEPGAAARFHLGRFLAAQAVDGAALASAQLVSVRDLGEAGRLVHLRQELDGVELSAGDVKVLLRADNQLVALSGALRQPTASRGGFRLSPAQALAAALSDRFGVLVSTAGIVDLHQPRGRWEQLRLDAPSSVALGEPAHFKPVYFPEGEALRAAFVVEFSAHLAGSPTAPESFRAVVDAEDGRVLARADLTASDAFQYRVFAEPTGERRPADGPTVEVTPYPGPVPTGVPPAFAAPNLVSMEGFNRNPQGQADAWLKATATQTSGNNVDAYGDTSAPDGFSNGEVRATLTGPRTFDTVYDLNAEPLNGGVGSPQQMAAITNAFYVVNWLHDAWYNAGFDELAGNNQTDNFGRGGLGGDAMRVEVQDNALGGFRNNANMSTPADGFAPRMQIYLWSGFTALDLKTSLAPATTLATGKASFGPTNFSVTGPLVLAADGVGASSDGCEPLVNNVVGRVALVDRGTCNFAVKTANAQAAGAIGVLIADNRPAATPPDLGGSAVGALSIGTLSVTQADGAALKAGLLSGPVTVTVMSRSTSAEADGSLDNLLVAHEYGHFLHHRLQECGSAQCGAMSEGWGDFLGAHLSLRDGDDLAGTYSTFPYAARGSSPDSAYFGNRRYPLSTDLAKNPLTFQFVADQGAVLPAGVPIYPSPAPLSEVHNAGEVWAVMLFDAYVALQQARPATETFAEVRDRFARDIVTALQLAPRDSTYTEMRDALLAAVSARSAADATLVAQAFARRGMGSCAVSPPREASGLITGVVESTVLAPSLTLGTVSLADDLLSCDQDGLLDAEERGRLVVAIGNAGAVPATGSTLTVTSTTAGVTVVDGVVALPDLPAHSSRLVAVEVTLAPNVTLPSIGSFDVTLQNAASCVPQLTTQWEAPLNTDTVLNGSATDDVESDTVTWTPRGAVADQIWARATDVGLNHVWRGLNFGEWSDTSLESPDLQVGSADFVVTFTHKHSFEFDGTIAWDGAVIELSENGGQTWNDVTTYGATPGYGGVLPNAAISNNPLGDSRLVFTGTNPAWPGTDTVRLDFGTQLANQTVRLRFRIGTDRAASGFGWQLDDLAFAGLVNTPFAAVVPDAALCQRAPVASAGPDQTVSRGETVVLDASGSSDLNGDPLTFAWAQTAGPGVTLITTGGPVTGFVAPRVPADTVLTFEVRVSDGADTTPATVNVTVRGNGAPVADAGGSVTVASGAPGVLDGAASSDPDGDPLTYQWTQTSGPAATLGNATRAVTPFTAPAVTTDQALTFELLVSDGTDTAKATVTVAVTAPPANRAPVAVAGAESPLAGGATGVLDASGSSDPDGDALTFAWTQVAGPTVALRSASPVVTTFTAPEVEADTALEFEVQVSDAGGLRSTASVSVTVTAPPKATGCAGCSAGAGGALWLLAAGVALLRRRRQRR